MNIEIISGDLFKDICDDHIYESKTSLDISKQPSKIFLFTNWVRPFIENILPHINFNFKLVTHNSDAPVASHCLPILNDNRLIHWYGMNCSIEHPKLTPIPIGIANEKWPHGKKEILKKVINTNVERKNRIYCNFNAYTSPLRQGIKEMLSVNPFIDIDNSSLSFEEYLLKLKSYKYVISPPGNSVDCHRIWESIYVGTVPIILKNIATNTFSDNLPIITLNTFINLDMNVLEEQYNSVYNRSTEMADLDFYKNLIIK
jgi:hypothetical protein